MGFSDFDLNSEPIFNFIKFIILESNLSPIFFFTICAIVTVWLFWKYLDNGNNQFASLSIIIFLSLPGLYFNTFNIVRQYFSAAIFLYSLKYIKSKQLICYILCITTACLMHISSIILFPLYFVLNKRFSFKTYIIFTIGLIIIAYSLEPIFNAITLFSDRFSLYLETEEESNKSTITFLCLIILFVYFINRKTHPLNNSYDDSPYMVMTTNMFILYTIFSVMTFVNFYFYRITFYFGASLCIIMPNIIFKILKNRVSTTIVCLLFSFAYFFSFIIKGKDDPTICSDNILPITSIFDISPI